MKKWLLLIFSAVFVGVLIAAYLIKWVPPTLIAYSLVMGLLGYLIGFLDIQLAVRDAKRLPKNFLLILAAAGGWVGTFIASVQFHDPSSKWSFQWRYYLSMVINIVLIYVVVWLF